MGTPCIYFGTEGQCTALYSARIPTYTLDTLDTYAYGQSDLLYTRMANPIYYIRVWPIRFTTYAYGQSDLLHTRMANQMYSVLPMLCTYTHIYTRYSGYIRVWPIRCATEYSALRPEVVYIYAYVHMHIRVYTVEGLTFFFS